MRSMNPVLQDKIYDRESANAHVDTMTMNGTIYKSFTLVAICFLSALFSWDYVKANPQSMSVIAIAALVGGLGLFFIIMFNLKLAAYLAPLYAILQGAFLGGISMIMEQQYPGIAIQAILLTLCDLVAMLILYRSGLIKVTNKFRTGVMAAGGAIFLIYMISMVMGFFGSGIPMIHESGTVGIGFSVVVVGVASLFLILDFDNIERGVRMGAPKHMEWVSAFGLLVTLIWLYMEMLRLLSKMRSR